RRVSVVLTPAGSQLVAELAAGDRELIDTVAGLPRSDQEALLEHTLVLITRLAERGFISVARTCLTCRFHEQEGGEHFEARSVILGDTQMGGDPTPFDRIQATRLAARSVEFLQNEMDRDTNNAVMAGYIEGKLEFTPLVKFPAMFDADLHRPREQWWMEMRKVTTKLASATTSGN
ncbi:MAG TPA: hypothetical protein PLJ62_14580, partial [Thermoflexales bacterium]|nr:hypothetical protein [Thermoflexales bacterium]